MTAISRIIELFNEIETTPEKKEEKFEEIQDIVKSILQEKGMNELTNRRVFAGELEIIYNSVIQSKPILKDWVEEFLLINYEKESKYFLPDDDEGADYGGKRKSKKSKKSKKSYNKKGKSRKSKKSRKSYNKKGKSRKSKKY